MRLLGTYYIDDPALPVLRAVVSFEGITSANGNALGTTIVDADLTTEPSYQGLAVKLLGGDAAGQVRPIALHPAGTNTLTVINPFTDNAGAVVQVVATTPYVILSIGGGGQGFSSQGLPYLTETWQDVLGIDFTVWQSLITATGSVTRSVAEEPYQKVILAGPANADTARLRTVQEWQLAPDTWGFNTISKLLIMEWEARFATPASIEETTFFMGLSASNVATRATTHIAGFILDGAGVLNAITDDGVSETTSAVGGPVLTDWNKYAIVAYGGVIAFWINGMMRARHTTVDGEDLPDINAHGMFYVPQEAGVNGGELHIATVGIQPGVGM